MKTTVLTLLGIFTLTSMVGAYPRYEFGAYAGSKLHKRTTVAITTDAGQSAKKLIVNPGNFNKGTGYKLK